MLNASRVDGDYLQSGSHELKVAGERIAGELHPGVL